MTHYFVFGGVDSRSLGITLREPPQLSGAVPRLTRTTVPGRNGDLTSWDGSFDNRTLTLECNAVDRQGHAAAMVTINKASFGTMGYKELALDTDPDHYLLAQVVSGADQTPADMYSGRFALTFDCSPERWLYIGTQEVQVQGENLISPSLTLYPGQEVYPYAFFAVLDNPGYGATPIFILYGYGQPGTLTVGDTTVSFSSIPTTGIVVDSLLRDCYSPDGAQNLNNLVSFSGGEYPLLHSGANMLSWDGASISRIIMQPRWWDL